MLNTIFSLASYLHSWIGQQSIHFSVILTHYWTHGPIVSITINTIANNIKNLIGSYLLSRFDDEPTDKENEAGEQKQVEQIAMMSGLGHRRHSAHRWLQKSSRVVKVIILQNFKQIYKQSYSKFLLALFECVKHCHVCVHHIGMFGHNKIASTMSLIRLLPTQTSSSHLAIHF